MQLTATSQAILLLTVYFKSDKSSQVKPLTVKEWGKFAFWLKENSFKPDDLLKEKAKVILEALNDIVITKERIKRLLGRSHTLALSLEKWNRAGIWVVTRSDDNYPRYLKKNLNTDAPPVLFGCGDISILNTTKKRLAIVGSRNVTVEDISFTSALSEKLVEKNYGTVVSGGAKGVDEASMLSALKKGGEVIGVLANDLLQAALSAKWRQSLMNNKLVLVSPFNPEASFNVGNAMARNKYIYCLSEVGCVVHSGKSGGTYTGALENLNYNWIPLWVKDIKNDQAANQEIIDKGGLRLPLNINKINIKDLFVAEIHTPTAHKVQEDIFDNIGAIQKSESQPSQLSLDSIPIKKENVFNDEFIKEIEKELTFYDLFLEKMEQHAQEPVSLIDITEYTGIVKSQITDWLNQAIEEQKLEKKLKPVRYMWKS